MVLDQSTYLENVADEIFGLDAAVQKEYARALRDSLRLDIDHNPPQPETAKAISRDSGIPLESLRRTKICLTKKHAHEFLTAFGISDSEQSFARKYNTNQYVAFFDREPTKISGRTFLLTYAEWIQMTGHRFEPPLPQRLKELF